MAEATTSVITKSLIDAAITSGRSPEEVLEQLNSCGIETHVTEQGDLMIRYWQVGAEDFVSPEHVAHLRMGRPLPANANNLEWVSQHLEELRAQYPGQWIAVVGGQVVGSAQTLPELMQVVEQIGVVQPFITQVPAAPVIWNMTYAG